MQTDLSLLNVSPWCHFLSDLSQDAPDSFTTHMSVRFPCHKKPQELILNHIDLWFFYQEVYQKGPGAVVIFYYVMACCLGKWNDFKLFMKWGLQTF